MREYIARVPTESLQYACTNFNKLKHHEISSSRFKPVNSYLDIKTKTIKKNINW